MINLFILTTGIAYFYVEDLRWTTVCYPFIYIRLVKEYLGLSEKDGLRTWTVASSILGVTGFALSALEFYIFG